MKYYWRNKGVQNMNEKELRKALEEAINEIDRISSLVYRNKNK